VGTFTFFDRTHDFVEARIPMHSTIGDDLTHYPRPELLAGPGDHDDDELFEDESDLDDLDEWDEEDEEEDDEDFEDWDEEDEEEESVIEDEE
jgi:hypothetical protein